MRLTDGYFDIRRGDHNPTLAGGIDPSGYVKGWAIKNAAGLLNARHISRYCVDAGGDIQVRGRGPGGGPWQIGIRHPLEPTKFAKLLYVTDGAVATSGIYERGRHIYNPHTGKEVTDPLSLTVVGGGAVIDRVDALATAAFCMGREGLGFLRRQGYEVMMISADAQVVQTLGFGRYESAD
jgi:thiamine biosynthesis lipoprotein